MQHVVLSLFFVKNLKNVKMYYCVLKKYCVTKSHNYLFLALSWATLSPKKNLNLRIKTKPVPDGTVAKIYTDTVYCICLVFVQLFPAQKSDISCSVASDQTMIFVLRFRYSFCDSVWAYIVLKEHREYVCWYICIMQYLCEY